jgi:hypothetical protein
MRLKSFRRFFFDPATLDEAHTCAVLDGYRFRPIDPDGEEERALGVCQVDGPAYGGTLAVKIAEYLCFGVRADALRIPGGTLRHYVDEECVRVMNEQKVDNLNRYQRAEVKERVKAGLRKRVPPTISHSLVVLDTGTGVAYVGATSPLVVEELGELLEKSTNARFIPESCYSRAVRALGGGDEDADRVFGLDLFDLGRALAGDFVANDQVLTGGDYLDRMSRASHLGAAFILWLWWRSDVQGGVFDAGGELGAFELWFDDKLVMGSPTVNAQTDTFRGGHPATSAEAREALRLGKLPIQAKVGIVRASQRWDATLRASDLAVDSLKVPAVLSRESDEELCEAMLLTEQAEAMLDGLYAAFLRDRMGAGWPGMVSDLLEWIRAEKRLTGPPGNSAPPTL